MRPSSLSLSIRDELARLEPRLSAVLGQAPEGIAEPTQQVLAAGGKRLRPALAILAAMAGNYDFEALAPAAVSVELIHLASLIHDDVLDKAETRRGQRTINLRYGNDWAVAAGDYLFGQAFSLLARCGNNRLIEPLSEAALCLSLGEMLDQETAWRVNQEEAEYFTRIYYKTAALFVASCRLGARSAGVPQPEEDMLANYGRLLGIAFQISDDVLDITGDQSSLGKPVGTDIRDGRITLPIIYALSEPGTNPLPGILSQPNIGEAGVKRALRFIKPSKAVDRAKRTAADYAHRAVESISGLNVGWVKDEFALLARFVIERSH